MLSERDNQLHHVPMCMVNSSTLFGRVAYKSHNFSQLCNGGGFCRIDKSWSSLNVCDGLPWISENSNGCVGCEKRAAHGSGTSRRLVFVQILLVNYFSGCLLAPLALAPLLDFIFQLFFASSPQPTVCRTTSKLPCDWKWTHWKYLYIPKADAKRAYNELHQLPNIIFNKIFSCYRTTSNLARTRITQNPGILKRQNEA